MNCYFNFILGVIGSVNGTYVPCSVPKAQKAAYTNRKMFTAATLQAICDHRLKYIDCFVGFPSSLLDNRIFKNSYFYQNVSMDVGKYFDEGEYILGDKAYPAVHSTLYRTYESDSDSEIIQQNPCVLQVSNQFNLFNICFNQCLLFIKTNH